MILRVLLAALVAAPAAGALELPEGAELTKQISAENSSYLVPSGPAIGGIVPSLRVDGHVSQAAWRVPRAGPKGATIFAAMRQSLIAAGHRELFVCKDVQCGGFDFRFAVDVLPAPDMYVDLQNFQFASFVQGPGENPTQAATILISARGDALYVQHSAVGTRSVEPSQSVPASPEVLAEQPAAIPPSDQLIAQGHIVLEDVDFETGATSLVSKDLPSLAALAKVLAQNPSLKIALVGHTDSTGSLDGNVRISQARAEAVRERLIRDYDVPASQVDAAGMGYLAPRASNLTEEGRDLNRRVEAIVLSEK